MKKRARIFGFGLVLLAAVMLLAGCVYDDTDPMSSYIVTDQEANTTYNHADEYEEPYECNVTFDLNGVVMSAFIPNISATGDNLRTDVLDGLDGLNYQIPSYISSAIVENDRIYISGDVDGVPFQVEGYFSTIFPNGDAVVFNATDTLGNFRVINCAVKRPIEYAIIYFRSFAYNNSQYYSAVTQLYLAPHDTRDFVMIEIFGNTFPTISIEAIDALPHDHERNFHWYVREFQPINILFEEEREYR